jgi:transposase
LLGRKILGLSQPAGFNGMDAPTRNGIDVPKWMCHTSLTEEGVTMKITTIGIDLAKSVFQIHGQADGTTVRQALRKDQ